MESKYPKLAPDKIESLSICEVFVFGSNLQGHHTGGTARYAYKHFGAEWGVGIGQLGNVMPYRPRMVVLMISAHMSKTLWNMRNLIRLSVFF